MAPLSDKRDHPRKSLHIPIKCMFGGKTHDASIVDLSQGGARIQLDTVHAPDRELIISLPLGKDEPTLQIMGLAVWKAETKEQPAGLAMRHIGVKFSLLDRSHRLKIVEYLKENDIERIVILTLDSIYSNRALKQLIDSLHGKIVLLCLSQRFSKRRGSFIAQTLRSIRESGIIFTNYLSFYLLYHNFFITVLKLFGYKNAATIKELARKYNIPLHTTDTIKSKETIALLKSLKPDLLISSHFDQKVSKEIIDIPRYGCINLHYALLPRFRGPFPSFWARLAADEHFGVSIHYMDEEFDKGDILQQEEIPVKPDESILSIDCRLFEKGAELILKVIEKIETGTVTRFKQELLGEGSYYSFLKKDEMRRLKRQRIPVFSFRDYLRFLMR
jgi:methionyl-tRNA formyltransferase